MKRFVRRPMVQSTLAWLLSAYLRMTIATMRWRYENRERIEPLVDGPVGVIACFWHGRIAIAVGLRKVLRSKPRRVLISRSPDGEFIAKIVARLGFPAIRGSSGRQDPARTLRGFAASRDVLKFMDDGGVVAITPDGPLGPTETLQLGALALARISEAPVVLMGIAARPALTLKSWDHTRIPLPFGRGGVVFEGPIAIPRETPPEAMEGLRADWQARMRAAQARADALVA